MTRAKTRAAGLVAAAAVLSLAAPATASTAVTPSAVPAHSEIASAAGAAVYLVFDKNPKHPTYSKLTAYKGSREIGHWRAGSGTDTRECHVGSNGRTGGWLPDGAYAIKGRTKSHNGRQIKGYAIRLADKRCNNGKGALRNELFIHSRMNVHGASLWRGDRDYRSVGCIKLRPDHIKALFAALDRNGEPTTLKVIP
ncbi:L,D-transpeptidase family protein [Streptomyces sp. NPDC094048]|uniref:L,D-transpeptidase n=1 Tax=unclassified Streptomyces TaxID=2593676 RepID=UPI00332C1399